MIKKREVSARAPMVPVPSSLGGGTMQVFHCRGPAPGMCSVPG